MSTGSDSAVAQRTACGAEHETHFKRVLGLPALVFSGLAYMVPLTVWTTYGVVTTSPRGHLPAAYVVTTVAMLLTAYSYGGWSSRNRPPARPTATPPAPS